LNSTTIVNPFSLVVGYPTTKENVNFESLLENVPSGGGETGVGMFAQFYEGERQI